MSYGVSTWDVVLTSASNRVGYTILRSLARSGLRVGVGVDEASGMAVHSRYCAGRFRHPSYKRDPAGFVGTLADVLRLHPHAVCIPTDEDAFLVAEHVQSLGGQHQRFALAPPETLRLLDRKDSAGALAQSLGIPTPATTTPKDWTDVAAFAREHPGPALFKLTRSSSARGVFLLRPETLEPDFRRALRKSGRDFGDFVIQELVTGTGYGVSLLCDQGTVKARFTHRRLRQRSRIGGPSTLRQSARQNALEESAEKLLRSVSYHGVAMVEFICNETSGRYWFLEVNPRWWGSVALAVRSGVDFPLQFYRMVRGEPLPPPGACPEGVTVRWLLGDFLALSNRMLSAGRSPRLRDLFLSVEGYDDFHADDPVPLVAELILQLRKAARSRLSRKKRPAAATVWPLDRTPKDESRAL